MSKTLLLIWRIAKGALKKSAIISGVITFLKSVLPKLRSVLLNGGVITENSILLIATNFVLWTFLLFLPCFIYEYVTRQHLRPKEELKKYKP